MTNTTLPYRHRYAAEIEDFRPGFVGRILLALRLARRPQASSSKKNWHYSELDTTDELVSILCRRDGRQYSVMAFIPPKNPPRRITHG